MAIVIVASLLLPLSYGIVGHFVCSETRTDSTTLLWTPVILLNSPYDGNASAVAVTQDERGGPRVTTSISASDGKVGSLFSLDNWTLTRSEQGWVLGPGPNERCGGVFGATDESRGAYQHAGLTEATVFLSSSAITTDAGEASNLTLANMVPPAGDFGSVQFDNGYSGLGAVTIGSCTGGGSVAPESSSSNSIRVSVGFPGAGGVSVTTELPVHVQYSYQFGSGSGGTWSVEDLAAGAGGGLAFQWSPCV